MVRHTELLLQQHGTSCHSSLHRLCFIICAGSCQPVPAEARWECNKQIYIHSSSSPLPSYSLSLSLSHTVDPFLSLSHPLLRRSTLTLDFPLLLTCITALPGSTFLRFLKVVTNCSCQFSTMSVYHSNCTRLLSVEKE